MIQLFIYLNLLGLLALVHGSVQDSSLSTLDALLRTVAGVYQDPPSDSTISAKVQKTVIITACNHGYLNHLFNFDCFMKRLNLKYLVAAFDTAAYDVLSQNTSIPVYNFKSAQKITPVSVRFKSKQFNELVHRKVEITLMAMKLGYDVLFSDIDIAIVRDPFPYLLWNNVDYVHSYNGFCTEGGQWSFFADFEREGNSGFYYVKSNNRTIKLWDHTIAAFPKYPGFGDQRVFWNTIRASKDPPIKHIQQCRDFSKAKIRTWHLTSFKSTAEMANTTTTPPDINQEDYLVACMLDDCMFSAGGLLSAGEYLKFQTLLHKANQSMVMVHANWVVGNTLKRKKMKEFGFWLLDEEGHKNNTILAYSHCLPFRPRTFSFSSSGWTL